MCTMVSACVGHVIQEKQLLIRLKEKTSAGGDDEKFFRNDYNRHGAHPRFFYWAYEIFKQLVTR